MASKNGLERIPTACDVKRITNAVALLISTAKVRFLASF